jgi:hypothetical protein
MTDSYILYSNEKDNQHIFIRKEADGKETVVSSREMELYSKSYPTTMDLHHALIRFMFDVVDGSGTRRSTVDDDKMESILSVPFDKMKDIIG